MAWKIKHVSYVLSIRIQIYLKQSLNCVLIIYILCIIDLSTQIISQWISGHHFHRNRICYILCIKTTLKTKLCIKSLGNQQLLNFHISSELLLYNILEFSILKHWYVFCMAHKKIHPLEVLYNIFLSIVNKPKHPPPSKPRHQ